MQQKVRSSSRTGLRALIVGTCRRSFSNLPSLSALLRVGFLVLATSLVPTFQGAGQNLVQNGSFETGDFTGWTTSGDTTGLLITIAYPHAGARSLTFGSDPALAYVSQTIPTTPGQNYLLSFWVWNEGDIPNQLVWNGEVSQFIISKTLS